jgi:hypothetical protein
MFVARYAKQFIDLNKNVYIAPKNDKGNYEAPVPVLGTGGGTIIPPDTDAVSLNPPARVSISNKELKPFSIIYRVVFPLSEMEIASNKPEYFNYMMDRIILKAINNYRATVGDENKVRFGTTYCDYARPGNPDEIFRQMDDDFLELRFFGSWASEEEV